MDKAGIRKGFSFLEIIVALAIVSAAFFPIFQLMSGNLHQQNVGKKTAYANLAAKRILERLLERVRESGTLKGLQNSKVRGLVEKGDLRVSPHFQEFDGSLGGISLQDYPSLHQELLSYTCEVLFHSVPDQQDNEDLKRVEIRVSFQDIKQKSSKNQTSASVVLHAYLSPYRD